MKKILIIDDEPLIGRALMSTALSRGYLARSEPTAERGLQVWREWNPDFVFLDLILPDQSGLTLLESPHAPAKVIMMSAYGQYRREAEQKGADLFLLKPFENIFQTFDEVMAFFGEHSQLHPPALN